MNAADTTYDTAPERVAAPVALVDDLDDCDGVVPPGGFSAGRLLCTCEGEGCAVCDYRGVREVPRG